MRNFKFLKNESTGVINLNDYWETRTETDDRLIYFTPTPINDCEFCFQFDDNQPVAFGSGPNQLTITINPTADGSITFNDGGGRVFKIFARQRQND